MWSAWAIIFAVSVTLFLGTIFLSVPKTTSSKLERTKSHG